jgi:hypothetical protein
MAQPADAAEAPPQQKFEQARDLFHDGHYPAALELFQQVYEATGSPNAHLFVARCYRELGSLVEAYEHMSLTVSESSAKVAEESRYATTRDSAARELAELGAQVGLVSVLLTDQPEGAQVTVAEEPIPLERLGSPIAVNPGTVTIVARALGIEAVTRKLQLRAGESKTVAISLRPGGSVREEEPTRAPGPAAAEPTADQPALSSGLRTAGFVTAGVGVAGMIVFAVAGSMASSKFATLEDECGNSRCDASQQDTVDSGRSLQTVANVGLIVGAVGLVAGTTMIVLGWPSEEKPQARVRPKSEIGFGVGQTGASLRYSMSF